jgi:GDP-L-fucose synthase
MFVTDVADAMLHFMDKIDAKDIGGFVNIGFGKDMAIRDLAFLIKDVVGYSGEITFDASKPDGMPRKLLDVSFAARFGWTATIDVNEGLRRTYKWYSENLAAA